MASVRLARMAMGSRFELILEGENEAWLRAAGEEALSEIERLDRQLTIFSPVSDVSRINERAAREAVPVEPRLFALLQHCTRLHEESDGAFDITVGPLMRAWGFYAGSGRLPAPNVLEKAREVSGMHLVHLDAARRTVSFERDGVRLDFGAIGKGYAVDEAVAILREAGVDKAFLHGGTSTACGIGTMEDGRPWKVAIPYPGEHDVPVEWPAPERAAGGEVDSSPSNGTLGDRYVDSSPSGGMIRDRGDDSSPSGATVRDSRADPPADARISEGQVDSSAEAPVLAVAPLEEACLSVSAVWGKAFESDGATLGHVLDPRLGRPVDGALMTAVVGRSATEADALSTALLVLGRDAGDLIRRLGGRVKTLVLFEADRDGSFEVIESDFPTIPSHRHHRGPMPS